MQHRNRIRVWRSAGPETTVAAHLEPSAPARGYLRRRDLPRLLALWPEDLEAASEAEHELLLARLHRALRRERSRGTGGHWTYDLARHALLLAAYRAELAAFHARFGRRPRVG
jgi:hypothetical protein